MKKTLTVLFLLCPAVVLAQAPQLLGYQGRLVKTDGTPESGNAQMRFGLFSTETGGAAAWEETQAVALTQGYYSTYLGRVTTFPATLFDSGTLWLELSVQAPGDTQFRTMTPRLRVGSVAFALSCRSVKGGTVDATNVSINGTQVIDSNGRLTASAGYSAGAGISIDGTTRAISVNSSGCSPNQVLQWNGATWQCGTVGGGTGGGLSSVTGTAPVTVTNGTSAPVVSVAVGTASGTLAAGDDVRFSQLAGRAVSSSVPTAGTVLGFSGTEWGPVSITGIPDSGITSAQVADGAITVGKLASMGCVAGQVLQYNGTAWVCTALPMSSGTALRNAINFSDLTVEGTPIASSISGNLWRPEWAFDKNKEANSTWFSAGSGPAVSNEWIGLDFGTGNTRTVQTVAVWNMYGSLQYGVPVYTLERSADCSNWTAADAPVVGQTQVVLHWLTFPGSTTAARCWRIKAGAQPFGGAVQWGVTEISMFSTVVPRPTVLSGGDLASYPKEGAFDGLKEPAVGTGWCAVQTDAAIVNAAWVGYDFGTGASRSIRRVVVSNWRSSQQYPLVSHTPTAYWVERSNDCTTWTTVMRSSTYSRTAADQIIDLPSNAGAGRCWRVRAANSPRYTGTATYWCAEEVELYE
jgi:hypothetical protein